MKLEQGYLGGNANAVGQKIETDVDAVHTALKQATELASYAMSVVNRICGYNHESVEATSDPVAPEPAGLFPSLGYNARNVKGEIQDAMAAIRRLENSIS